MTPQEIFDTALERVCVQGEPSIIPDRDIEKMTCAYATKTSTGKPLHCAVGILMNERERELYGAYDGGIENLVNDIAADGSMPLSPHLTENVKLLGDIQGAHDSAAIRVSAESADFVPIFKNRMRDVAVKHDLKWKE